MTALPQAIPAKQITVSQTTLFAVAARELGDAMEWNRIAALNAVACTNPDTGLIDPWITGPTVLLIPTAGTSNGGILEPTNG